MAEPEYPEPESSLGARLLAGVLNLWDRTIALEKKEEETRKVVDHQGLEMAAMRAEHDREMASIREAVADLDRQLRGAKISKGRARAKSARLEAQLDEAKRLLTETEARLN